MHYGIDIAKRMTKYWDILDANEMFYFWTVITKDDIRNNVNSIHQKTLSSLFVWFRSSLKYNRNVIHLCVRAYLGVYLYVYVRKIIV